MGQVEKQQEDGYFPRINATMSNEDRYQNMIVSIVGKQLSNDGQTLTLETGDNATAKITIDPSYEADPSTFIEVMGCVTEKGVVQHFVTRPLGDAFDMGAYNEVIELMNGKYQNLFHQQEYITA